MEKNYTPIDMEMEFTLDKVVFQKDGFVIARVFSQTPEVKEYLNYRYKNVSIKGNMPSLKNGIVYKCNATSVEQNQYGYTLSVTAVYPRDFNSDSINTDYDMVNFIDVFVGAGTAEKVKDVKNICIIVKEKQIDELIKIKGIGEKIAEKIINTYNAEAVGSKFLIKLKKLGFTDKEIKSLQNLYNDNLMIAYEQVCDNIFNLVYHGFRLDRMDMIFLEHLKGKKDNKHRMGAYIWKGLRDYMIDGYRSYAPLETFYNLDIIQNIINNVGEQTFNKCIKDLVDKKNIVILNDEIITTFDEWNAENKLVNLIHMLIKNQNVTHLPINDIEEEIDEQEEIIGFKLNEGQRQAVKDIVMSECAINMLNGFAGTGKSTITKVILNIYEKYNQGNFKLCALSGRASSILGESSGYVDYASTIHKTLGGTGGQWSYDVSHKFKEVDVVVIDEISMIDYSILYSILAPCDTNTKILLLGDSGQLPSLSFGKTIETLKLFNKIQVNELTQVMRQSEDAYILKIANDVRRGINPFEKTKYKWYGEDVEVCIGDSYNYMLNSFMECYKQDPNSSIICTTTKQKTDMINFDIQDLLIDEGIIDPKGICINKPSSTKGQSYKIYVGNHIMVLKNNYSCISYTGKNKIDFYLDDLFGEYEEEDTKIFRDTAPIFNGEIYVVKDIFEDDDNKTQVILTDGTNDILIENKDLECQLAYACNCHKLQGSGFPNVFIYHNSDWVDKHMMVSKQWLYTAYTRAKGTLRIHTDNYTNLIQGIKTDAIDNKVTIIDYCDEHNLSMSYS